MRCLAVRALLGIGLVCIAGSSLAATVTFSFTGTVTFVDPAQIAFIGGPGVVSVGDKLQGTITYDFDSSGACIGESPPGTCIATSYGSDVPPGNMSYTVGSFHFTTPPGTSGFGEVVNNNGPSQLIGDSFVDGFTVGSGDVSLSAASTNVLLNSVLHVEDTTRTVFSDTSLPHLIDLTAFDLGRLNLFRISGGLGGYVFQASIDTLAGLPVVNDLVTLDSVETSSAGSPVSQFAIVARFTNTSSTPLPRPVFKVTEISGNTLLNGGPGGVGFVLTPNVGPDFVLSPGESFEVEFLIALHVHKRFSFFVDLVAEAEP
jgi:hypothetical protein